MTLNVCKDYDTAPRIAKDASRKSMEDLAKYSTEFAKIWTKPLVEAGLHPAQATAIVAANSFQNCICLMECMAELPDGKQILAPMFAEMRKLTKQAEKELIK